MSVYDRIEEALNELGHCEIDADLGTFLFEGGTSNGEEVVMEVDFNVYDGADGLLHALFVYADEYDADEYAAMLFEYRTSYDAPLSASEIAEIAQETGETYNTVLDTVRDIVEAEERQRIADYNDKIEETRANRTGWSWEGWLPGYKDPRFRK